MTKIKYLWNTLVYTTYTSVYFAISIFFYNTWYDKIYNLFNELINSKYFNFFQPIKLGLMISGIIFSISVCIFSVYKIFYNLFKFYTGDNISINNVHITVDDNFVLRDSYMEFSDGTKVPVHITKLSFKKSEEENKNGEEKA